MQTEQQPATEPAQTSPDLAAASEEIVDAVDIDGASFEATPGVSTDVASDQSADEIEAPDAQETEPVEAAEPPAPKPIRVVPLNEKFPASAGCRAYWREAGFECRAVIEHGRVSVTCKGPGSSLGSQPIELLLRRQFVSQGDAIAFMMSCLSFDPNDAPDHGFEIVGRTILPT